MKKGVKILMVLLAVAGMWSCNREEHLNVDPTLLYGRWVQVDKPYYWTFNADGTGNLVNREAVQEGDADNGDFTWTLSDGDQLLTEFRGSGELGGMYIPKLYTIKEISTTSLRWEDQYGRSTNFNKTN
jgi:hypothetical protein